MAKLYKSSAVNGIKHEYLLHPHLLPTVTCVTGRHKLRTFPFPCYNIHTHTGLQFEKTCPDTQTFTHTESRSSQESLQMRDVHIQAFTAHYLRSFDSACDQYICVQCLSHHLAPLCHFHPVGGMNLSPRKLEKIRVCLSVCIWGGLPVFRQSCYKHQKHQ